MSRPKQIPKSIKIWIVEDRTDLAQIPWAFIDEVKKERCAEAEVFWIESFGWPPRLHDKPVANSVTRLLAEDDYPDIVVLDLCLGDRLEGDQFLGFLRKWEKSAERRSSFVLFWSEYFSMSEVRDFVNNKVKEDLRTKPVDKRYNIGPSNPLLKEIRQTWQLIEVERDF